MTTTHGLPGLLPAPDMRTLQIVSDLSDEDLWQRVLSGDGRAFGSVWDRHRDRVFRHLVGAGNALADAEDLSAVVFLELWRRRTAIRFVSASALPWLIVTAHNVHRNAARARARHRALLARLPPPSHVLDHAVLVEERSDPAIVRLREAIRASRPSDAQLLTMVALEAFSVHEAALALGITEGAAKMRLSRLRRRLKADLTPYLTREGVTDD